MTAQLFDREQAEIQISHVNFLYAPVQQGDICGSAKLLCNGAVLDETALICAQSVALDTEQEDTGLLEKFRHWWDVVRKRRQYMKITVVYGQNHKGSTYRIARMLAEKLDGDISEIFLPRDFGEFCVGCAKCILHDAKDWSARKACSPCTDCP